MEDALSIVDEDARNLGTIIGRNLARIQATKGITDAELARATGKDPSYFSRLKRGEFKEPGFGIVVSLANACQEQLEALVPTEYLGPYAQSYNIDVAQPIPVQYFQTQYGMDYNMAALIDTLARYLSQQEVKSVGRPSKIEQPGVSKLLGNVRAVFANIVARIVDDPVQSDNDDDLVKFLRIWSVLTNDDRKQLLRLAERISE